MSSNESSSADGVVVSSMMSSLMNMTTTTTTETLTMTELPAEMRFNEGHVVSIVFYSLLMVFGGAGNATVLALLLRRSAPRTRINGMLVHLAVADLLVIFLMMPLEIGWAATVSWKAGDAMCRIMSFWRTFGLYLSGFILMCISIDRYYAVLMPLQLRGAERRGKYLVLTAWIASMIVSAPQAVIFHVESHPNYTSYEQCVAYNVFQNDSHEFIYSMFNMFFMYGAPLLTILFCYISIIIEIIKRSKDKTNEKMRRSSNGFLGRARIRTVKMTLTIVCVFVACWTPYYIMCLWYWMDKESAKKVDIRVQKALFLFASTNSCMNPLVYGLFNVRARAQDSIHRIPTRRDLYSCEETIELQKYPMTVRALKNRIQNI